MSNKEFNVAIVGATGAVGEVLLEILAERQFPVGKLFLLASERSAGSTLQFNGKSHRVTDLIEFFFAQVQFAFFSAGGEVSKEYAPIAAEAGAIVIDNTSYFRNDDDIPLIVPEVNAHAISDFRRRNIIANPNCSTAQMVVALKPIYDAVGITRINVATYQSVSGAGNSAIQELAEQTAHLLNGQEIKPKKFKKQIAFNVIPQIDSFEENGYTREEMKMVWETQKIMEDPNILVNATAVRVPVFFGHSEVINIETREAISAEAATKILREAPGIIVLDDHEDYPTAVSDAAGQDAVYIGRIREDISHPHALNMWVVSDNIRKGAALNAVQIAELLLTELDTSPRA
jgi:aspartate-semialdehyde dehydrogenase